MGRRTLKIIAFAGSVLVVAQYTYARTGPGDDVPRAWVWISGAEDGSFHAVDSAVDSQV